MSEPNLQEPARSTSVPPALVAPTSRARSVRFMLGIVCVAAGSALFAVGFRYTLGAVLATLVGAPDVVSAMRRAALWQRVALPAVGGLLAGLMARVLAGSPRGGGVSDVMEAVVLGKVRLPMRSTLLKSLASWFAAAGTAAGSRGISPWRAGARPSREGRRNRRALGDRMGLRPQPCLSRRARAAA